MPLHLPPWRVRVLLLLLLCSGLLCAVALTRSWVTPGLISALVARQGSLGRVVYVLAVVLMELLWFPRMWGLLAGGLLFGPWQGVLLSMIGDLGGGLLCYWLARGAGQTWVSSLLAARPRASQLIELLAHRRGVATVALLRLCPVAHYTAVSYAAGLTGVSLSHFLLGTAVGLVPGAVLYSLVGDAVFRPSSPTFIISVTVVVLALLVTCIWGRRILKA
jgi:uncharacterized membrane protein YdjX (TVP38/TMEM64 family)